MDRAVRKELPGFYARTIRGYGRRRFRVLLVVLMRCAQSSSRANGFSARARSIAHTERARVVVTRNPQQDRARASAPGASLQFRDKRRAISAFIFPGLEHCHMEPRTLAFLKNLFARAAASEDARYPQPDLVLRLRRRRREGKKSSSGVG